MDEYRRKAPQGTLFRCHASIFNRTGHTNTGWRVRFQAAMNKRSNKQSRDHRLAGEGDVCGSRATHLAFHTLDKEEPALPREEAHLIGVQRRLGSIVQRQVRCVHACANKPPQQDRKGCNGHHRETINRFQAMLGPSISREATTGAKEDSTAGWSRAGRDRCRQVRPQGIPGHNQSPGIYPKQLLTIIRRIFLLVLPCTRNSRNAAVSWRTTPTWRHCSTH